MRFTTIILAFAVATSKEAHARRRHLNDVIKGEDDASMSMASVLSAAGGGGSKSKSSPTPAPPAPGECNSIINTDGVFTLQKHLVCDCSEDPALTVDGRGTMLKLNGYTVECEAPAAIIKVVGTANTVMGPGTVKDGGSFSDGLRLSGGGFHTVDGVTIGPDVGIGISIFSDDNIIINNFITESEFDGVVIFGKDRNIIKGNKIVNGRIRLDTSVNGTADDNQVLDNTIISSGLEGIFVGGKRVVIQGNTIDQSGGNGIEVYSFTFDETPFISEDVIIKDNSITNTDGGILISSRNGDVTLNTVIIDNTFAGNGNDNLVDGGTGTVKAGNTPSLM